MKRIIMAAFFLAMPFFMFAQRFAVVDTEYILGKIPEYQIAQDRINDMAVEWQREIEQKFSEIEQMYRSFQAESVLLPAEMKTRREEEIIQKEKEAKDLQKKRFGTDGDLSKKRQELIKPIQDRVYNAVEEIATKNNFAVVFDKANGLSMLYVNPRNDISEEVLESLGYTR
ncbi:MAG: OmpH family outer membrane protein [Bacteroidales bacterium]|nr:OmpH family outer membrane protein [Bacteroidales bacterium]